MAQKKTKKTIALGRKSKPQPRRKNAVLSHRAPKKAFRKKSAPSGVCPVVHWEIQAQNPGKMQRFYADAFGWKIDANNPMQYGLVDSKGARGIGGGIGGSHAPGSRV